MPLSDEEYAKEYVHEKCGDNTDIDTFKKVAAEALEALGCLYILNEMARLNANFVREWIGSVQIKEWEYTGKTDDRKVAFLSVILDWLKDSEGNVIKALIDTKGIEVYISTVGRDTFVGDIVVQYGSIETIKYMFDRGAIVTNRMLSHALEASEASEIKVEFLLSKGADVNNIRFEDIKDCYGKKDDILKPLLSRPDFDHVTFSGQIDWLYAVTDMGTGLLEILLDRNQNAVNTQVISPFPMGCNEPLLSIANLSASQLLLKKGANVNIKNPEGCTPFMYACKQHNIKKAQFLAKVEGFDPRITDKNGANALYYAVQYGLEELTDFLCTTYPDTIFSDVPGGNSAGLNASILYLYHLSGVPGTDTQKAEYYGKFLKIAVSKLDKAQLQALGELDPTYPEWIEKIHPVTTVEVTPAPLLTDSALPEETEDVNVTGDCA